MTTTKSSMPTILIVEDNPLNMRLAVFLLESAGYRLLQASDAETGIALAGAQQPDLILMDIQLPGMDGLSATRQLKRDSATRAIKVIACTGLAMMGDDERVLAAGCDGYISKPISADTFLLRIEEVLHQC